MSRVSEALQQVEHRKAAPGRIHKSPDFVAARSARSILPADSVSRYSRTLSLDSPEPAAEHRDLARRILTQLSQSAPFAVMLTSVTPCDGQAAIAVPLAQCLAELVDDDVLVVDADLDHAIPTLSHCTEHGDGLAEVLLGWRTWTKLIRPSGVPRVDVLPAGQSLEWGRELLSDLDLAAFLVAVKARYRLALFATSAAICAHAILMAAACDATYLMVELERTPRGAALRAIEQLESGGARLVGCVATGCVGRAASAPRAPYILRRSSITQSAEA